MFFHKMKYTFKYLFRSRMLLFWTFIFPLILATCFYFAFKDIESNEMLKVINIGIVNNEKFNDNTMMKSTFEYLEKEDNKIFDIKYTSLSECEKLLENKKIIGYLNMEDEPNLILKENGINESIFRYITLKSYTNSLMINDFQSSNMSFDELMTKIESIAAERNYTINKTSSNISYTMIEYYTLIAMAALYSGILSITVIMSELANISSKGKRNSIAPRSKLLSILGDLTSSYITGLIGLALLFLYTIFVLKVDYGNDLFKVIITGMLGVLAGESLGVFIACYVKGTEDAKNGILIALIMAGSFFSGMMGITMKYIIDTNAKIINLINPAAYITDALYSLYYYDEYSRFYFDIKGLIIISIIFIFLSILKLRRARYDSV